MFFNRCILFVAFALAACPAYAVRVTPLAKTFPVNEKTGVLTVSNDGSEVKTFQMILDKWTFENGVQTRTTSTDVRFVPSLMTLQPGASQTVRFLRMTPPTTSEDAYRVVVKEIPAKRDVIKPGQEIYKATNMDFPWIWRVAGNEPQLSARFEGGDLLIKNTGTATAQLVNITAGAVLKTGLQGYVLPGEERRIKMGMKAPVSSVVIRINGKDKTLVVQ